eukprot:2840920-Pleurochrysis_carterae.AAC.3
MGRGAGARRGSWPRLRAVSSQGRGGRRRWPCARETGNSERSRGRARAGYTCDASTKTASVHAKQTKWRATAFA